MFTINDVNFNKKVYVNFQDGFNFVIGNSATGKTYLISMIQFYCRPRNIPCLCFNHSDDEDKILWSLQKYATDNAIIMFDNCDLIMTKTIEESLLSKVGTKVFMVRDFGKVSNLFKKIPGIYTLLYENNILKTNREHTI